MKKSRIIISGLCVHLLIIYSNVVAWKRPIDTPRRTTDAPPKVQIGTHRDDPIMRDVSEAVKRAAEYQRKLHVDDAEYQRQQDELEAQRKAEAARRIPTTTVEVPVMRRPIIEELPRGQQATRIIPGALPAEETGILDAARRLGDLNLGLGTSRDLALTTFQGTLETPAKKPQDVQNKRRKWAAVGLVGVGIAGLGGLIGALLGLLLPGSTEEEEITIEDTLPLRPVPSPKPIPKPEIDEGIVPPTPYPPAEEENKEYIEDVQKVVEFFSDVEDKFKETLETTSYFDNSFKMESSITIGETVEKVGIIYKFENELGTPFTPFLVTLLPQDISGYELDTSKILNRIQDGPAKELLAMMLKPKTSFVFLIKTILLINTVMNDKIKSDIEKVDFILSEIIKLYSRLILTPGVNPSPASMFAEMPESIRTIIRQKVIKIYSELLFSYRDDDRSPFIEKISQMRRIKDYNQRTSFIETEIIPLIKKSLSYTEKKILLHALTRHLSDLPKKDKALSQKINNLNNMLTKVVKTMDQEGIEQSGIDLVQKLVTLLKNIKKKPVKTPEFEISDVIYKDSIPLPDVMNVLFAHFAKIQDASFQGDPGYLFFDFMLGKNATRFKLQAIMLRCMTETLRAERILSSAMGEVKIRQKNGSTKTINPEKEFNGILKKASEDFVKAQTKLTQASIQLRDNPKNSSLKTAYAEATAELDKISKSLYENQIQFRRTFAVFYPLPKDDGSSITPWEFIKREISNLRKYSKYVDKLLEGEYAPFSKHFGFKVEDLK